MKLRLLCGSCLMMLVTVTAQAQKNIADEELDHDTGTRMLVRSVFDPLPVSGYAPMHVVATNGTDRNALWTFDFRSQTQFRQQSQTNSTFRLDVPARSTQSALCLVPVAVTYGMSGSGSSNNHTLSVRVSGTGFTERSHFDHTNHTTRFPAIAISESLAEFSMTALSKEVEARLKKGGGYVAARPDMFGSRFEPTDLPDSWLGFSGFDYVLLSSVDWQKLKPAVRRAVLEWVRFGGNLHIYLSPEATTASLGLPGGKDAGKDPVSLGRISTFGWDSRKLAAPETVGRYWGATERVDSLTEEHATPTNWPLLDLLGTRSFASWQVIVFLIVFGLLVGPVNLFVLAPAGKRHKLFVTTPLLSIGASIVMVGLILVQDGTGGMGRRFVAINLQPEDATAYVTQEQVSRTGVLMGASFEMKQPVLIEPLALPDTPWVKLKNHSANQSVSLTEEGRERRGNFFQSRAEQGQVLRAAVPTRARLELKTGAAPEDAPTLISALGFTVEELFYTDAGGAIWMLKEPLSTGRSTKLVKSDASAQRMRWEAAINPAVKSLRTQILEATRNQRPFFVAKAAKAPGFTLDTLNSIHWEDDQIVVFGPVAAP